MNEPMGSTNSEGNSIITIIAKLAPLVIPITSGDASGFLTTLESPRQKWPNYFPQLNLVTFSEFGTRLI